VIGLLTPYMGTSNFENPGVIGDWRLVIGVNLVSNNVFASVRPTSVRDRDRVQNVHTTHHPSPINPVGSMFRFWCPVPVQVRTKSEGKRSFSHLAFQVRLWLSSLKHVVKNMLPGDFVDLVQVQNRVSYVLTSSESETTSLDSV
jgi:hypothetical protein